MKRKVMALMLTVSMLALTITGCGNFKTQDSVLERQENTEESTITNEAEAERTEPESTKAESAESTETQSQETENTKTEVRIGSLKGPTSIGLMKLMKDAEEKTAANDYTFTMETAADALLPMVIQGELDIALVPANVASILYHKTEGGITVIDINTLGVLYMVSADTSPAAIGDLKGKTIYLTGKGTTPDYALHYILERNGISESDVTLEYKSEATEVAAVLANEPESIGLLPQPFVTAACAQNESLQVIFNLTEEWRAVQGEEGSELVTGVTIVRNEFLQENQAAVERFLEEHRASAEFANEHVEETAELVAAKGIIEKAQVAAKAIPNCNITYMDGEEMKKALSGYLSVLMEQNPESVGGKLPDEDFYYLKERMHAGRDGKNDKKGRSDHFLVICMAGFYACYP